MKEYLLVLKSWKNFDGRSCKREYWMFVLFNVIFAVVTQIIDYALGTVCIFLGIYSLLVIVPAIAVSIRRMHDIGKSGWWICISFIPLIGVLWFLWLAIQDSELGINQYGDNPKE